MRVVVTCEHGGNRVPAKYRPLFVGHEAALQSHRGWDPGALSMARLFARHLRSPLHYSTTTRLLVELNRSPHHRKLFSDISGALPQEERQRVAAQFYQPYRDAVQREIEAAVKAGGATLHLGVHTFTPVLDGRVRMVDVGLLYDPSRKLERQLCRRWRAAIEAAMPDLRVRMNQPYRGTADGLTTFLRKRLAQTRYAGIELEVNQRFVEDAVAWRKIGRALAAALGEVVDE